MQWRIGGSLLKSLFMSADEFSADLWGWPRIDWLREEATEWSAT